MTKCILIFEEFQNCLNLLEKFDEKSISLSEVIVVRPIEEKITSTQKELIKEKERFIKVKQIESVRDLNPTLDRQIRQRYMRIWLMPFGFIAGLTFSQMTNLSTFSFMGLNNFGETLIGGLLGMGSGYLGSIVASASINLNKNKEIRPILNYYKDGKWILLLENQMGFELPWVLIKESNSKEMIFLEN